MAALDGGSAAEVRSALSAASAQRLFAPKICIETRAPERANGRAVPLGCRRATGSRRRPGSVSASDSEPDASTTGAADQRCCSNNTSIMATT